ncbi:GNAT family N-acetyltransferase [Gillisia sp. M10.2A]|uniref:GNAT family N-acetyltransferase n=1 Tax=Gillisia lutea TaxID=2909668 RepID=A0ABS9EEJ3_9FLAO|nr:GNAT family N-acetyltransferase [Gillisia lutea]MCF4101299.1 GNAT family N-acetyltransferase [Gillisia lutea]
MHLVRTTSLNPDFVSLVKSLDEDLLIRDGEDHEFFSQFNKIDNIKYVVIAYSGNLAMGCGAIKLHEEETGEIKRMFVSPENRGKGIATLVLKELEDWAGELGCKTCILETGIHFKEAVHLYKKNNYRVIPNYGQYKEVNTSICFRKDLNS